MGLLDEMKKTIGVVVDDDYDDEDDGYLDEDDEVVETKPSKSESQKSSRPTIDFSKATKKGGSKMSPEIRAYRPQNFKESSREIVDLLLSNISIALNVEGFDMNQAQKIIDFVSGACYAIGGHMQRLSGYIFIITPANVDISGDFLDSVFN